MWGGLPAEQGDLGLELLPVCKVALPPRGDPGAQAAFALQNALLSPAQSTPARCGGSTCLGTVGRAQIPERPNPGSAWVGGCSVQLQDSFPSGGPRRSAGIHLGPGEGSCFCPIAPPGRMGCGNFEWVG